MIKFTEVWDGARIRLATSDLQLDTLPAAQKEQNAIVNGFNKMLVMLKFDCFLCVVQTNNNKNM